MTWPTVNMETRIPTGLKQWYGTSVIISRGPDYTIHVKKSDTIEKFKEMAKNMPGELLTLAEKAELSQIATRPTAANIEASGSLFIPTYLEEWLRPEGELRFRGNNQQILIDRSTCLCDDPACRKCLQSNCRDLYCIVHTTAKKSVFRA